MITLDFDIMTELKQAYPYLKEPWQKQNNEFDKLTKKIYKIDTFSELENYYQNEVIIHNNKIPFSYLVNRWYNHKTSTMVEYLFSLHKNIVYKESNVYHHTIDLYIFNTPFDIKLSVLPKEFFKYEVAQLHKREVKNELIKWLYKSQSREGRFHQKNRLFVVCKGNSMSNFNQDSKIIKSDFVKIKKIIDSYIEYLFNKRQNDFYNTFNTVTLEDGTDVFSDVLIIY